MQQNNGSAQVNRNKSGRFEIYGLWGLFKLIYFYTRTKIIIPKARLIRFPIEIRGKRYINFGIGLTTGIGCRIEAYPYINQQATIEIGTNVEINDYVHITGNMRVKIGNNVLIASKVYISDTSHGSYSGDGNDCNPKSIPNERNLFYKKVIIEDNVWIGESVTILPGVTIGEGSIIGANSVVTKSTPKNVIAVGNPARPIKKFNFDVERWEIITRGCNET